jgi:hypothetical protein
MPLETSVNARKAATIVVILALVTKGLLVFMPNKSIPARQISD